MRAFPRFMLAALGLITGGALFAQTPSPQTFPDIDLQVNGTVDAILRQNDGGIILGGNFTKVNGVPRRGIARITPARVLDPNWNIQLDGSVFALAQGPDGEVYVSGTFTTAQGLPRSKLVKLVGPTAGTVAPEWNAMVGGHAILTLTVDGLGRLYVGGNFNSIGGAARPSLARLLSGSTAVADSSWTPSPNASVFDIELNGSSVVIGGAFTQMSGVAIPYLARVSLTDGHLDQTWAPSPNQYVSQIVLLDSSTYIVAGEFTMIGGLSKTRLAKVGDLGSGEVDSIWSPSPNAAVEAMAMSSNGWLFVGGSFSSISGVARRRVAKLNTQGVGAIELDWNPGANGPVVDIVALPDYGALVAGHFSEVGGEARWGIVEIDLHVHLNVVARTSRSGAIQQVLTHADGSVIVAGGFLSANGLDRRGLIRLRPNGQLDTVWNPSVVGEVSTLALASDGSLFIGGYFTSVGGLPRTNVAKLVNITSGQVDPSWDAPVLNGVVDSLVLGDNYDVYIGGQFTHVGGLARQNLARVSATGSGAVDPVWNPGASSRVYNLVHTPGWLYAGGVFSSIGGLSSPYLARLSTEGAGAADAAWYSGVNGYVSQMAFDAANALYIGGGFTLVGGVARQNLARVNATSGDLDTGWAVPLNNGVVGMAVDGGGNLYVGGLFTAAGGMSRRHVVKVQPSGQVDPGWMPQPNGAVYTVSVGSNGRVYLGGQFSAIGNVPRSGLAMLLSEPDPVFIEGSFE